MRTSDSRISSLLFRQLAYAHPRLINCMNSRGLVGLRKVRLKQEANQRIQLSVVLSQEKYSSIDCLLELSFPFIPVLYFPTYNTEEKLLQEVNQNILGEKNKNLLKYLWKVCILTAQSIGFGSQRAKKEFRQTRRQSEKRLIAVVTKNLFEGRTLV